MAKKVVGQIKLQIPAGQATPAPPVGPALGQAGVNIMDFVKNFNARTAAQVGLIIPVVITVYADRSYTFITKTPPAAILLAKAAGVDKGSGEPNERGHGPFHGAGDPGVGGSRGKARKEVPAGGGEGRAAVVPAAGRSRP